MNESQIEVGSGAKLSPKFFFLSLGALVSLIASVTSFLILAFETLNHQFPDVLNAVYTYGYNSYNFEQIRGALATLIIFFPIYLIISYFWRKAFVGGIGRVDTIIRKWMIYLIIFLSAIVIAVDLVTLVRYFVSGEITCRFILKVLVALITAGIVGGYYLLEIKENKTIHYPKLFGLIGSLVVLAMIIISFAVMGTPKMQRLWRLDDRRVTDLQSIQWQVINYWQQKQVLPESLADLNDPISSYMLPIDPETDQGKSYEYIQKDDLTFELCATFLLPMPKGWQEYSGRGSYPMPAMDVATSYPYPGGVNNSWDHGSGRTCFSRTIDPKLYPPYPEIPVKE